MASTKVFDKSKCWNKNNCHSLSEMLADYLKRNKTTSRYQMEAQNYFMECSASTYISEVAKKLYIFIPHTKQ